MCGGHSPLQRFSFPGYGRLGSVHVGEEHPLFDVADGSAESLPQLCKQVWFHESKVCQDVMLRGEATFDLQPGFDS